MPNPTFSQIRAQVAAIRKHAGDARVFGIQSAGRWAGEPRQTFGDDTYDIVQCDSPLAMRVALQEEAADATATVLVTQIPMEQLSADIRVRLARRKLYPIKNWQIVKELFQAKQLDPRVVEHSWIAQRLLDLAPPNDYPPVPSGVLDAETVWGILLEQVLRIPVARPDLIALLKWSMDEGNTSRFRQESSDFQAAAIQWISQSAGVATPSVMSCVVLNEEPNALPIGLALAVIFADEKPSSLATSAVRIEERHVGTGKLNEQVAEAWHKAATELIRLHLPDAKVRAEWLARADEILATVEGDPCAFLSRTSPLGFEQRLARYGKAISAALDNRVTEVPSAVDQAYRVIACHDQVKWQHGSRRLQRVEMSARLLRWRAQINRDGIPEFSSLGEACRWHGLDGGFVDWARHALQSGEPVRDLSHAYGQLLTSVTQVREKQNKRFAELVRDWTQAGSTGDEVMPVEKVLEQLVTPLAAHAPLLVLVLDGMSFAVFRELVSDVTKQDWVEIRREDHGPIWPAIATLPSLTEVSRTSLLCGQLRHGNQNDERISFESHAGLMHHCRSGSPPRLLHKSKLQGTDETALADEVVKELESTRRRIVGIVINAVDDHLLKGGQIDIRWNCDEIKILPQLLHEAKVAGRLVVMLSDHGHILDRRTKQKKSEGGDRWRPAGDPSEGEVMIAGSRVVIPPEQKLIVPWTEKLRYGIKKNGYHGGVTMQEMVIPMAVLSARDDLPDGWAEPLADTPEWWFEPIEETARTEVDVAVRPVRAAKRQPGMLFTFEEKEEETQPRPKSETEKPAATDPAWLETLFASAVLQEQKKLGGRALPKDELIRVLLVSLNEQGGKLTSPALARKMQLPPFRLSGVVAAIQRILNVEGYPILVKDDSSDTIELNRELLCRQFGID
jgi:hypothetical protein